MAEGIHCEVDENSCYPLCMKELPEKFVKKSEVELGETPERREKSLMELRKLILEDKDLCCRTDDEFLIMFLRPRKFQCKRALATLKSYFELQRNLEFFFIRQSIKSLYSIFDTKNMMLLPQRDPEGRVIFLFKLSNWNPDELSTDDYIALVVILICSALTYPMSQVNGGVIIIDAQDFSFYQLKHITPRHVRLTLRVIQESTPSRVKAVHYVNESVVYRFLWMIVKPLLSRKLRSRVFFHGKNMESLHQYIPPSILPFEYGGNVDMSYAIERMKEEMDLSYVFHYLNLGLEEEKEEEEKLRNRLKEKQ